MSDAVFKEAWSVPCSYNYHKISRRYDIIKLIKLFRINGDTFNKIGSVKKFSRFYELVRCVYGVKCFEKITYIGQMFITRDFKILLT